MPLFSPECTYPECTLQVIRELDTEIMLAFRTELQILGTAVVFLQAEVLGPAKKMMEVAVIKRCDYNKEILVSLKNMKL